jgi:hypothetical protein
METIELKPRCGGWKVFEVPGVEPFFIGERAKEQALDYAKHRRRSNSRSIRILNPAGMLVESIAPERKQEF